MSTVKLKNIQLGDNPDPSKNFVLSVPAVADGTLSIKRQDGTSVLSIDATGKAVIPGVVGTVAQVGGIPTGQVVERGSNANGDYVRFADGTQICYRAAVTGQSVTANAYNNSNAIPFPAAFSNTPRVCIQRTGYPHSASNYSLLSAEGITATSWQLIVVSNASFNYNSTVHAIAIGRWF